MVLTCPLNINQGPCVVCSSISGDATTRIIGKMDTVRRGYEYLDRFDGEVARYLTHVSGIFLGLIHALSEFMQLSVLLIVRAGSGGDSGSRFHRGRDLPEYEQLEATSLLVESAVMLKYCLRLIDILTDADVAFQLV
ncbi:hypothetical protein DFH09DRAFT_1086933 [Mycena vulgaris]|nr:hypothetical protein DFH09DRAFT_1086933 [Mycena vulgaris]